MQSHNMVTSDGLLSFSTVISSFTHVVACVSTSFILHDVFFMYSPTDERLDCFHLLTIIIDAIYNNNDINIHEQVST